MIAEIIGLIVVGGILLAIASFLLYGEIRDAQSTAWFLVVYSVSVVLIDPEGWWGSLLIALGAVTLVECVVYLITRER